MLEPVHFDTNPFFDMDAMIDKKRQDAALAALSLMTAQDMARTRDSMVNAQNAVNNVKAKYAEPQAQSALALDKLKQSLMPMQTNIQLQNALTKAQNIAAQSPTLQKAKVFRQLVSSLPQGPRNTFLEDPSVAQKSLNLASDVLNTPQSQLKASVIPQLQQYLAQQDNQLPSRPYINQASQIQVPYKRMTNNQGQLSPNNVDADTINKFREAARMAANKSVTSAQALQNKEVIDTMSNQVQDPQFINDINTIIKYSNPEGYASTNPLSGVFNADNARSYHSAVNRFNQVMNGMISKLKRYPAAVQAIEDSEKYFSQNLKQIGNTSASARKQFIKGFGVLMRDALYSEQADNPLYHDKRIENQLNSVVGHLNNSLDNYGESDEGNSKSNSAASDKENSISKEISHWSHMM